MKISSNEAFALCEKYEQELVVIAAYDGKTLEVATFGVNPVGKDVAASWGEMVAKLFCEDPGELRTRVHEDYRATPAAQYKAKLDAAETALKEIADRVAGAVSFDGTPVVGLFEYWQLQQVARLALEKLKGQECT